MKFNPVVVRAIMHTQFFELKRVNAVRSETPQDHFQFTAEEVEEVHFGRDRSNKNVRFILKDGRVFDARGQVTEESLLHAGTETLSSHPELARMVDDLDAIDKLPLAMIPLKSATLRQSRLIKNGRLETMLELHSSSASGSLQVRPQDLKDVVPEHAADQGIINSLASLHSYDVYSLRMSLKKLGVPVEGGALELSEAMKTRLDAQTGEFTVPLVRAIFGDDGNDIKDRKSLMQVFRDTDRQRAAQRLKMMSAKTGIALEDLPKFLETYADTFLSVAYYEHRFETVSPDIYRCMLWLRGLRQQHAGQFSAQALAQCKRTEESLRHLNDAIRERLRLFRGAFGQFWSGMNKLSFEQLQYDIQGRYLGIGASLCGLVVKMRQWSQAFSHPQAGGPHTRVQFLTSEMAPGLEQLCQLQI